MEQILEQILSKLTSMDSELKDLKQGQQKLEQGQQKLEQEISIIKSQVEEIPLIKQTVMETNEEVKAIKLHEEHLETIQIDQQRIIDLLSARSIQHEAELKRIK